MAAGDLVYTLPVSGEAAGWAAPEGGGSQPILESAPVTVSTADLLALDGTPKLLVPSAGSGTVLVPWGATMQYKAGNAPFGGPGAFLAIINRANTGQAGEFLDGRVGGLLDQTTDRFNAFGPGVAGPSGDALSKFEDEDLVLIVDGALTGGNGILIVVVYYSKLTLS